MTQSASIREKIRASRDLASLIRESTPLKEGVTFLTGKCPKCSATDLAVSQERQLFHCYACKVGGDVVTFYALVRGLTEIEALVALQARSSLNP